MTFILHRSYSSFHSDSINPPATHTNFAYVKSDENTRTQAIIDLPLRIAFTIVKKNKLEFQVAIGASFQTLVHENSKGIVDLYGGPQSYSYDYPFDYFIEATDIGVEMGPVLKIEGKNGLMIQPEFRLIQLLDLDASSHVNENKTYSAGLKLGWFFNLN